MNADQLLDRAARALLGAHATKMQGLHPDQCTGDIDQYVLAAGARHLLKRVAALDAKSDDVLAVLVDVSRPYLESLAGTGTFGGIPAESQHVVLRLACAEAQRYAREAVE